MSLPLPQGCICRIAHVFSVEVRIRGNEVGSLQCARSLAGAANRPSLRHGLLGGPIFKYLQLALVTPKKAAPGHVPCQSNAQGRLSKLERAPSYRKINVTSKSPVGDISFVTLMRTDTTLDHERKAEKVWIAWLH